MGRLAEQLQAERLLLQKSGSGSDFSFVPPSFSAPLLLRLPTFSCMPLNQGSFKVFFYSYHLFFSTLSLRLLHTYLLFPICQNHSIHLKQDCSLFIKVRFDVTASWGWGGGSELARIHKGGEEEEGVRMQR